MNVKQFDSAWERLHAATKDFLARPSAICLKFCTKLGEPSPTKEPKLVLQILHTHRRWSLRHKARSKQIFANQHFYKKWLSAWANGSIFMPDESFDAECSRLDCRWCMWPRKHTENFLYDVKHWRPQNFPFGKFTFLRTVGECTESRSRFLHFCMRPCMG